MYRLWQEKLDLDYPNVIDMIQFGSSIRINSKPNDIDIAVIYEKISLDKQLSTSQKIKNYLKTKSDVPIDIHSFDIDSFFKDSNFSRKNILFYGKSLISGKYFANRFSLDPWIIIKYDLSNLEKKDKVRLNYHLSGKSGSYGMLKEAGKIFSPGVVQIRPEYEDIIISKISEVTKDFKIERVLKEL